MFDVVIFDFDGTLCDTQAAIRFCLAKTFTSFGLIAPSDAAISQALLTGMGLTETFESLCEGCGHTEIIPDFVSTYRRVYNTGAGIEHSALFEGVADMLEKLDSSIVVVSNKGEQSIFDVLRFNDVAQFVDLVVGDDGKTLKKPNPESFKTRIQPHYPQAALDRTLVVGDTIADIQYAQNIGARSCWVSYGYGDSSACRAANPHFIANRPLDVIDLIRP